jgi:hypothetical protein
MKLKQLIAAYKALGEAKVTKLDASEVLKIIKSRKEMRPHAESYEAFLKDCQEKMKPEIWPEIEAKAKKWDELTDSEKKAVNKVLMEYNEKINAATIEELEREIEVSVEALSEESIIKILQENNWPVSKLEEVEILL